MDFFGWLGLIGTTFLIVLLLAFLIAVGLLYWFLKDMVKPNARGWLFVALICALLLLIPDPLDVLTGGFPIVQGVAGLAATYKVIKHSR